MASGITSCHLQGNSDLPRGQVKDASQSFASHDCSSHQGSHRLACFCPMHVDRSSPNKTTGILSSSRVEQKCWIHNREVPASSTSEGKRRLVPCLARQIRCVMDTFLDRHSKLANDGTAECATCCAHECFGRWSLDVHRRSMAVQRNTMQGEVTGKQPHSVEARHAKHGQSTRWLNTGWTPDVDRLSVAVQRNIM